MKSFFAASRWPAGVFVGLLFLLDPARADAQIYEWVDDANIRHFTTSLDSLPERARPRAEVFVEMTAPIAGDGIEVPTDEPSPRPLREESRPFDDENEAVAQAFAADWNRASRAALEPPLPPVGSPPVVLQIPSPFVINVLRQDPSGLYYRSPYEGVMSVPFDGGRSRGLTLRQLVQEQRRMAGE